MSKSTRNSGKPWTPSDVKALGRLAGENTPTRVIGLKLGRTEDAIRASTRPLRSGSSGTATSRRHLVIERTHAAHSRGSSSRPVL